MRVTTHILCKARQLKANLFYLKQGILLGFILTPNWQHCTVFVTYPLQTLVPEKHGNIYNWSMHIPYPLLCYWFIWHNGRVYGHVGSFSRRVERSLLQQVERATLAMSMLATMEQLFDIL